MLVEALAAFLEIQSFDGFQAGHSFRRYPDAASFLDTSKDPRNPKCLAVQSYIEQRQKKSKEACEITPLQDQTAKAAGRAADEALDA
eukprot:g19584.t1